MMTDKQLSQKTANQNRRSNHTNTYIQTPLLHFLDFYPEHTEPLIFPLLSPSGSAHQHKAFVLQPLNTKIRCVYVCYLAAEHLYRTLCSQGQQRCKDTAGGLIDSFTEPILRQPHQYEGKKMNRWQIIRGSVASAHRKSSLQRKANQTC